MKSIKEHQHGKSDFSLQDIIGQSFWYTRCALLSVSLMSGFGLPWNYDSDEVKKWFEALGSHHIEHSVPESFTLIRAIYKKGDPHFYSAFNGNRKDYKNFIWDDSSFTKAIIPASQSYLIINEIELAKYFYKCSKTRSEHMDNMTEKAVLSLLLTKSAALQSQFMSDYLRNTEGLIVSKSDISENLYGEPVLKEIENSPNVSSQALALKAFSKTASILGDDSYPLFRNREQEENNRIFAGQLFSMFMESPEDTFGSKTRDLCSTISACIEYYSISPHNEVLDYITRLSLELESRIDMSGNLMRFPDEDGLTSNSTCFMAVKTLIEAYRITGLRKFQSAASLLYRKLDFLWDSGSSLYCLDSEDKFKYTLRDVGMVIGGLNSIRLFGEEEYRDPAAERLVSFFNSAVNSSGLIQSCIQPPAEDDCEHHLHCSLRGVRELEYESFCSRDIPQSIESGVAPVFGKKFTYKPKKHSYKVNSSSFYSDYALLAMNEFLCMSYPEIDCFSDRISIEAKNSFNAQTDTNETA